MMVSVSIPLHFRPFTCGAARVGTGKATVTPRKGCSAIAEDAAADPACCLLSRCGAFSPTHSHPAHACHARLRRQDQIQAVINAGLIQPLVELLSKAEFDIKKEVSGEKCLAMPCERPIIIPSPFCPPSTGQAVPATFNHVHLSVAGHCGQPLFRSASLTSQGVLCWPYPVVHLAHINPSHALFAAPCLACLNRPPRPWTRSRSRAGVADLPLQLPLPILLIFCLPFAITGRLGTEQRHERWDVGADPSAGAVRLHQAAL